MSVQRESIWPQVKPHEWKWRVRTRHIDGILWHATRGGQWYDGNTELNAYLNWCRSPNNRVAYPGGDYAGIASYGIGPGRIVECVPDGYLPAWSSRSWWIWWSVSWHRWIRTLRPSRRCLMFGKWLCWFKVGETTPDPRLEELAVVIDRSVGEWTKAVQELMAQHERLHDSAPPMRRVK